MTVSFKGAVPEMVYKSGKWVVKTGVKSAGAPFSRYFWSRWGGMAFQDYEHKHIASLAMRNEDGSYWDPSF